jgi:hypothetical protein
MRISKKARSLVIVLLILVLLFGAGIVARSIFLRQIKEKIQSSFGYTRIYFSFLPPALVLEDARTKSLSPFFSAKKVAVSISLRSLLTKEKPLNISIDRPTLRIYETLEGKKGGKKEFELSLPFSIQKGLIKEGELFYWGKEDRFQARGINVLFLQRGDRFSVKAEAEESMIFFSSVRDQLEGKVSIQLDGQGKEIEIQRLVFQGREAFLRAGGSLRNLFEPDFELKAFFKLPTPYVANFLRLPFSWEGKVQGEGILTRKDGLLAFRGDFSSEDLVLNRVAMNKVQGRINFMESAIGTLELNAQRRSFPSEFLRIYFGENRVWGEVRRFYLDSIMNYVGLTYPISSPVWGSFSIERGDIRAEGEFRDEMVRTDPDRFPVRGPFKFQWKRKGEFSFSSPSIISTFAQVEVEGNAQVGKHIDLRILGEVRDLNQARHFTSLILTRSFGFPEIRGKGQAELRISGDFINPQVEAGFQFSPGGFDRFDVDSVKGQARIAGGKFFGRFDVDDPFMEGRINLFAENEEFKAGIQMERALVEKIFPPLNIKLPLSGEGSGNFEVVQKEGTIRLKGNFSSPSATFENLNLTALSGKLEWEPDLLSLSELQFMFHQGRVKADFMSLPASQEFNLDAQVEEINLSSLDPSLKGTLFFNLKGKGVFGRDLASGSFEIRDLEITPLKKTEIRGAIKASYTPELLHLELEGNFFPGENRVNASVDFPFREENFSAEIKGAYTNLDLLLPWRGVKGKVNYLVEIKGPKSHPQVKGVVDFKGSVFPFPRFAQALQDYSGLMFIEDSKVTLRSLKAKLGGGEVQGFGEIRLGEGGVKNIDIKIEGKDMLLSPIERTRAYADGNLNLIKDSERFILQGDFRIHRLLWRREIYEKIAFSSSPYYSSQREPGFFDDLTLNIRLRADDDAWMENSLGRLRGRFDLTIGGSIFAPVLLGEIEVIEGAVYFQDRKFEVLRGMVSFFNPSVIEPYLNFKGETFVKNYRVVLSLAGFIDQLNPELSSSPPLPPEDVLALLAVGEAFKRTYSYDTATQLSTASLLSIQLSEEAEKRAEKLFSIDRFRITPFILGSSAEMTARLTIGKKIARDFSILYSTNLTTQREELARIEWELTDDFSIVGMRDEEGRLSLDVKVHKRF